MKELTLKQITNKLRCIFDKLLKLEQRTFEQVNADWNATSGVAEILNKPVISTSQKGFFKVMQNGTNNPSVITMNSNLPSGTISLVRDGVGSYYLPIPSGWGISTNTTKFMITIAEFSVQTSRMDIAIYGDGMGGLVAYFFVKDRATNNPIDLDGEFKFSIDKF